MPEDLIEDTDVVATLGRDNIPAARPGARPAQRPAAGRAAAPARAAGKEAAPQPRGAPELDPFSIEDVSELRRLSGVEPPRLPEQYRDLWQDHHEANFLSYVIAQGIPTQTAWARVEF